MAFYVIHTPPGLGARTKASARRHGPRFVNSRSDYASMLRTAGFAHVREVDVTREFGRMNLRWLRARLRHEAGMRRAAGDQYTEERIADVRTQARGINTGLLRRSLFVAW
mgnify:CR=1 FL=1